MSISRVQFIIIKPNMSEIRFLVDLPFQCFQKEHLKKYSRTVILLDYRKKLRLKLCTKIIESVC